MLTQDPDLDLIILLLGVPVLILVFLAIILKRSIDKILEELDEKEQVIEKEKKK